jgi:hypothetical protein
VNITRHQLIGFGCTKHQAAALTKGLTPVGKQNRSNLYSMTEVIEAIATHLARPRIRKTTRVALQTVQTTLMNLTVNVITVPFGAPQTDATDAVKQLLKSASNPKLLNHKMRAAEIKGKQLSHAG